LLPALLICIIMGICTSLYKYVALCLFGWFVGHVVICRQVAE